MSVFIFWPHSRQAKNSHNSAKILRNTTVLEIIYLSQILQTYTSKMIATLPDWTHFAAIKNFNKRSMGRTHSMSVTHHLLDVVFIQQICIFKIIFSDSLYQSGFESNFWATVNYAKSLHNRRITFPATPLNDWILIKWIMLKRPS